MGRGRVMACCVAAATALAIAGCGSSGSGTGSGTSSRPTAPVGPKGPAPLTRGAKGEEPGKELAQRIHLTAADCKALAALAEERLGPKLARVSIPKPPRSECKLNGPGVDVNIYLDTGFAANRRYRNRIVETDQFNYRNPAGVPHPVPHVGEKAYDNLTANWIPALGTLLAVRGNRWLTVTLAAQGVHDKRLEGDAATLARAGFKLTGSG